ncbi:2-hydroxychromene-2-carboxylate isomerase [Myxococcota bacterium]|nr:2-hydroxychromene-2-carboxylate isomerase [Myxococcota bacterium]
MSRSWEYWFDFSCPYAYLASAAVEGVAARTGSTLVPKPLLLGGVFRALEVPQNLSGTLHPAKAKHNAEDLQRWAKLRGVPLVMPAGHPLRTVDALRALLAVGEPFMPLAHRFFRAYWVDGIDLGTKDGVRRVLVDAGLDADRVMAKAESAEIKDELRRRTDEGIAKGIFGVPAMFVGDDLYWGQDRLDFVEAALGGKPPAPATLRAAATPVDFWFDYSSPFTYLAAMRVDAALGAAVTWRPMLLGGLFRVVGTPDVPMFTQSASKQRHTSADLARQAARHRIPFSWPSRFPMNTVLALRATLLAQTIDPLKARALAHAIFRAFWIEDRDLAEPSVIEGLANVVGLDGAELVRRSAEMKDALRRSTDEAAAAGVFGAPTFVVHLDGRDGARKALYWGSDRLDLAVDAARTGRDQWE